MTAPFRGSASGLTPQRLRAQRFVRLSRDVYVLRHPDLDHTRDLRTRVRAARVALPGSVLCHLTAAQLLQLPVDDDGLVHLDRGAGAPRSRRQGITVHRWAIPASQILVLDGIEVADGPRTVADLSGVLDLEGLVAVGDVVLRRWGPDAVATAVDAHGRKRGAALLRRAYPLFDTGADSPAETRARLRLHGAGFTGLRHGVVVRDQAGGWLARPDLADPVACVAVQHEGVIHFAKGIDQRRRDVSRDEVVRAEGWQVVVSTALDDARPQRLIDHVTAAYLRAAQLSGAQLLPPHLR